MSSTNHKIVYIAKLDYLNELCAELTGPTDIIENMVFSSHKKANICFALDAWPHPVITHFDSITEAARLLRQAGKFWMLNPITHIRRSHLIAAELRKLPVLQQSFPIVSPLPPIGCFSLLDKNTLIYSTKRWKQAPLGQFQFIEDKKNPPNRAYLKLWEALSLLNHYPKHGDLSVDLGASPGGWTYVMQSLGCRVLAIDKAPLAPHIAHLPQVTYQQQSAFAFTPDHIDYSIDWLLSDVACYPERLYDFVLQWIASNKVKHIIFTLKLQGETNLEIIEKFQAIPGGRVIHLFHNKHEATFFYPAPNTLFIDFEPSH